MPYVRNPRSSKKSRKSKRTRSVVPYGSSNGGGGVTRNYTERLSFSRRAFPTRNFTLLKQSFQGLISPGTGPGLAGTGFFFIPMSALPLVFNQSGFTAGLRSGIVPTGGSAYNQQFPGFTDMSAIWGQYKVHRCRIRTEIQPTVVGDQLVVSQVPYSAANPVPVTGWSNDQVMGQARGQTRMITNDRVIPMSTGWVTGREISGMSKPVFDAQQPYLTTTQPSTDYATNFFYRWATVDNAALSANVVIQITIEIEVEMCNLVFLLN